MNKFDYNENNCDFFADDKSEIKVKKDFKFEECDIYQKDFICDSLKHKSGASEVFSIVKSLKPFSDDLMKLEVIDEIKLEENVEAPQKLNIKEEDLILDSKLREANTKLLMSEVFSVAKSLKPFNDDSIKLEVIDEIKLEENVEAPQKLNIKEEDLILDSKLREANTKLLMSEIFSVAKSLKPFSDDLMKLEVIDEIKLEENVEAPQKLNIKEEDLTLDSKLYEPDIKNCEGETLSDAGDENIVPSCSFHEGEEAILCQFTSTQPRMINLQSKDRENIANDSKPSVTRNLSSSKKRVFDNQQKGQFKCAECNYECNQMGSLEHHLLTHSNTNLFKCSQCSYECKRKDELKVHLLTHSNTKLFKCSDCDYECIQKSNLKVHLLSHLGIRLFKCSECDYESNYKANLKRHLLEHSNIKLFKCSECDYGSNHKGSLNRHLLVHSNTKFFKCSQCIYECKLKHQLDVHLLTHLTTKLIKCSECAYECNLKTRLKSHMLTHSTAKLFKCSECDYESNHRGPLKVHLLGHFNTKLFKCSECDYESNHKGTLKRHLLVHSTKVFKCSECDYECNKKVYLELHLLTHLNMGGI